MSAQYEQYETVQGKIFHLVPESDFENLKDHILGLIEQLYESSSLNKELVEHNISEMAAIVGMKC